MSQVIPEGYKDLLERKVFANLGFVGPEGQVAVNPMWVTFDGEHVLINTARGRLKDRWMRQSPRVSLSLQDPDNPYRYLEIRGRVVEITEEGADQLIDDLAEKYLGQRPYPWRQPGEVRVIYKVKPEHCTSMG